jgi:hypothetical protein
LCNCANGLGVCRMGGCDGKSKGYAAKRSKGPGWRTIRVQKGGGGGLVQGWETALWRALMDQWLDRDTTIPARVLDWLVHDTPPTHGGVDIAWPHHPHPR